MSRIHIQFTLFSAFYTPLIATMSEGFLKAEGLDADWSISPPGVSAVDALLAGDAQIIQTAPSQSFSWLADGMDPPFRHFAQINEMDGFFLTGREPEPDFEWSALEGAEVVLFKGGQPRAMFDYACKKAGIDPSKIKAITPGGAAQMDAAFRAGDGAYVQQQGPFPQQLEADGIGHIVAQTGPLIGPNAFSSAAALTDWLDSEDAEAFCRAYAKTRAWINEAPADEVAASIESFFPETDRAVLATCIASYKGLGCWTPHLEITPDALDVAMDVFAEWGTLIERCAWDQICAPPPA